MKKLVATICLLGGCVADVGSLDLAALTDVWNVVSPILIGLIEGL